MAFMLPVYTGEEIKKMQDGRQSHTERQAIHIQQDIRSQDSSLGVRRARTPSALEVTRDLQ